MTNYDRQQQEQEQEQEQEQVEQAALLEWGDINLPLRPTIHLLPFAILTG